ncbi:hypothetical protein J6590_084401 [Homalodisca vitripennis]|nr:hypothetical protein J6590_084401 [Homalodisca vitripennis]
MLCAEVSPTRVGGSKPNEHEPELGRFHRHSAGRALRPLMWSVCGEVERQVGGGGGEGPMALKPGVQP